jgi:hypothetical protein
LSPRLSHHAPDFGVLPIGSRLFANLERVHPSQSFELTPLSRILAFIREPFSLVSRLLTVVSDAVPLVSKMISFDSHTLAPSELILTSS